MYTTPAFGRGVTFFLFKQFLSQYVKILCNVSPKGLPLQNGLRWLLRRGSPLPIPNREVKPDCADGTAVMWESMSLPFFLVTLAKTVRVIFL